MLYFTKVLRIYTTRYTKTKYKANVLLDIVKTSITVSMAVVRIEFNT